MTDFTLNLDKGTLEPSEAFICGACSQSVAIKETGDERCPRVAVCRNPKCSEYTPEPAKLDITTLVSKRVRVNIFDGVIVTGVVIGFESQMVQMVYDDEQYLYDNPYMLVAFKKILEII